MPVERLRPADAAAYRALMLDAYGSGSRAFTSTVAEREHLPINWWRARMAGGDRPVEMVLGVRRAGRLCAVAGLAFERRERLRHKASLFGMWVAPEARRLGVGRALVEAVLAQAAARPGIVLVQLTVTQGNVEAQSLYERCGFRPFGVEPLAVAFDATDSGPASFVAKLHMWCNIADAGARTGTGTGTGTSSSSAAG